MNKPKDISLLLKEIIDSLIFNFEALTSEISGDYFVLTSCNTYWLRPLKKVIINNLQYEIISVVEDESITIKPIGHSTQPTIGVLFQIDKPIFRHGTAKAINSELSRMKGKTPFIWLHEIINEEFINDDTPIERNTPIRLFFFDDADIENWFTKENYTDVIRPLKSLVFEFLNKLEEKEYLFKQTNHNIVYLPDWGEFNKSFSSKIFDEKWSGIELKKTITTFKQENCLNENCN